MDRVGLTAMAAEHGFGGARFARVDGLTPAIEHFDAWLAAGRHGTMGYLASGRDERALVTRRLPTARTAMVLMIEHHHRVPPDPGGRTGRVARYAWGRDYHNLVGKRLKKFTRSLRAEGLHTWGGVDTAPILERGWAAACGAGFPGKNCVQIIPARTSWMFLAVVFLDVDVEPDPPLRDHCGRCQRCLLACPTAAFTGPRTLDARRCLAYWTIEARTLAPRALRAKFGRWFFGCDLCQEVCPHNAAPPDPDEDDLRPRNAWIDLDALLATPDEALMERFLGTPLRRPRAEGLKRNALITLGNLGDPGGLPSAEAALVHPSPMVRGAAVWCLGRLGEMPPRTWTDADPLVLEELVAVRAGEVEVVRRAAVDKPPPAT